MKGKKNTLLLALIMSSIVLLLALQVLWLTNAYEKAYFDLRRQTSDLFRFTVFAVRDSLLVRSIEKIPNDSVKTGNGIYFTTRIDTLKKRHKRADSGLRSSQIQIYMSTQKVDTVRKIIQPLASRIHEGRWPGGNTFIVRLGNDSLSVDSLGFYYNQALERAGLDLNYEIEHTRFFPPLPMEIGNPGALIMRREADAEPAPSQRVFSDRMHSEWVRFDPMHRYAVVLSGFRPYLLREIAPQILFSFFLTLLTAVAFVVMYRSIRSQQRLMQLKNDFISNITHELKTPITTVGVAIEALKNFQGMNNPALTEEYLGIAQSELNRLSILTDKVLRTAIFEDKGVEFKPEPVVLDKLVEQVINSMKLIFEKQDAKIKLEKTGHDFTLAGSNIHLTSVVYNLLDNALKYTLQSPEIRVKLQAVPEKLILSVQDNGIGIAPEFRKKVFEKFFRVPTGDVHNIKGYGLGLSYVESVVKSHGGTIRVESEPGKGSNFIVELPKTVR
jgi:two-component system phosphate regulon sensor histidine kinase PhoR